MEQIKLVFNDEKNSILIFDSKEILNVKLESIDNDNHGFADSIKNLFKSIIFGDLNYKMTIMIDENKSHELIYKFYETAKQDYDNILQIFNVHNITTYIDN